MPGPAYHPLAKVLHWLTALCVLGLIAVGLSMTEMPISLMKLQLYAWHGRHHTAHILGLRRREGW